MASANSPLAETPNTAVRSAGSATAKRDRGLTRQVAGLLERAHAAGAVRHHLTTGEVMAPVAGAFRRGLTVVTANTSEFSRVAGLSWEDWTA